MESATNKKIIISVTSDLVSDNRVHKISNTLTDMGFQVTLIGRKLPGSLRIEERKYSTIRFRLPIKKGPLFYACFNARLFLYLLFSKFDVLLSNDLDTLPANFIISRLKRKPLVYDSHEYFTEVPELMNRPGVKRIWEWLEQKMVPHVHAAITVNRSLADIYSEKYKIPFHIIRNFPAARDNSKINTPDKGSSMVLYQGALNMGRGLEQAILAMKYLQDVRLVIAGEGDKSTELMRLAEEEGLLDRVEFLGKIPIQELTEITPLAAVGLSVEQDIGLNYHYALPNKLFDYIQARVPVLVTNLPEMAAIVKQYEIGEIIQELTPEKLAEVLLGMLNNEEKMTRWKKNLELASREFTWEKEEKIIYRIFNTFLTN